MKSFARVGNHSLVSQNNTKATQRAIKTEGIETEGIETVCIDVVWIETEDRGCGG